MNYRLLLSEMLIDYSQRLDREKNRDKRLVYEEVKRDLILALEIEPSEIKLIQDAYKIINK